MKSPSFESLISAPWPEPEESPLTDQAFHLTDHHNQPEEPTDEDDSLEHTVILGYN